MAQKSDHQDFATINELAEEFGLSARTLYSKVGGSGPIEKRVIGGVTHGRRSDCAKLVQPSRPERLHAAPVSRPESGVRSLAEDGTVRDPETETRKRLLLQAKIEREQRAAELERMAAQKRMERELAHDEELRQEAEIRRREAELRLEEQRWRIEQDRARELEQRQREREDHERYLQAEEDKHERERALGRWTRKWFTEAERWMQKNDVPFYAQRQGTDAVRGLLERELRMDDEDVVVRREVESLLAHQYADLLIDRDHAQRRQQLLNYARQVTLTGGYGYSGSESARLCAAAEEAARSCDLDRGIETVDRAVRRERDRINEERELLFDAEKRQREQERREREEEYQRRENQRHEEERAREEERYLREEKALPETVKRMLPWNTPERTREVALSEALDLLDQWREEGRPLDGFIHDLAFLVHEIAGENSVLQSSSIGTRRAHLW